MSKHHNKSHGDPVFFGQVPNIRAAKIIDKRPTLNQISWISRNRLDRAPPRFIGAHAGVSAEAQSGTLIPVSEFRPLVKRLIDRGDLDPRNVDAAVRKLSEIATKLVPEQPTGPSRELENAVLEHGEHFSPLIAVKQKSGRCFDWTAVFTAMARGAGLKTEIEGDPAFFRRLGYSHAIAHVWPVVTTPDGRRIKVIGERNVQGMDRWAAGPMEEHVRMSQEILMGNHHKYEEHVPREQVIIPRELKVDRPDVFG